MRQRSLLDSFIQRQITPSKKLAQQFNNQCIISSENNLKKIEATGEDKSKKINKINKMNIDSDQQNQVRKPTLTQKKEMDLEFNADVKPNRVYKSEVKISDQLNSQDFFTDKTPQWATRQKCRDKQMRRPGDPQYDPTTLYIPPTAWNDFSAPMKQFWKIKSENFDKIVLFKLGKFYELFYQDAATTNKYLDLKYMGTKMHTGFPQKSLDKYTMQLIRLGFKVVVVEQMETPQQMNERVSNDKRKGIKSQKTLNRDVTQILTKGTAIYSENEENFLPNYLISVRSHKEAYGFSLLQVGTNAIIMGMVDSFQKFKTVLFQTRPVQLLYDPDNLSFHDVQMMTESFLQMVISKVPNKNHIWHPLNACNYLDTLQTKSKVFQTMDSWDTQLKNILYSTLSGMFQYLRSVFKFDYVMSAVRFSFYSKSSVKSSMILDSQALQHLQIFETAAGQFGSLFKVIDRTRTKFGKRLFRRWMMSPLFNEATINGRLDALEDLQEIMLERDQVSQTLKKIPDIERIVNKLYHYAVKSLANKAIYFEDLSTVRLKQFRDLIGYLQSSWNAIEILRKNSFKFKSKRLLQLITVCSDKKQQIREKVYFEDQQQYLQNTNGILPEVISHLQQFNGYLKWQGDVPVPQNGLVHSYDQLQDQENNIKQQLQIYIESVRYLMKQPNIKFTHTKQRYELEIPQISQKRRPNTFIFSSKRAGYSRYVNEQTRELVKKLQKVQTQIKQQMALFVGFFFDQFKKKQSIWQRFIAILAEIDCLIGMSVYTFQNNVVRPKFNQGQFSIKNAVHPCLKIDFIPNNIIMSRKVMLITGPNMGGKSTLLRTTCVLVIMAQMGMYVPASQYNCQLIDRIFTRIGASDQLQQGKSTFFIELQQTKSVLVNASPKSLAIMDELGRGTSTFDGMAIAYSVLQDILSNISCYCLFATHYQSLTHEFSQNKQISFKMMDCSVINDRILFHYKLVDGIASHSFGINVAKVVGINQSIIQRAKIKATEMEHIIETKRNNALYQISKRVNLN